MFFKSILTFCKFFILVTLVCLLFYIIARINYNMKQETDTSLTTYSELRSFKFTVSLMVIASVFMIVFLNMNVQMFGDYKIDHYQILETTKIVKGDTKQSISGKGFGMLTVYSMNISTDNQLSYYYKDKDNFIKQKSVDMNDVLIVESKKDTAKIQKAQVYYKVKWKTPLLGISKEGETDGEEKYILTVPRGTVTGDRSNVINLK